MAWKKLVVRLLKKKETHCRNSIGPSLMSAQALREIPKTWKWRKKSVKLLAHSFFMQFRWHLRSPWRDLNESKAYRRQHTSLRAFSLARSHPAKKPSSFHSTGRCTGLSHDHEHFFATLHVGRHQFQLCMLQKKFVHPATQRRFSNYAPSLHSHGEMRRKKLFLAQKNGYIILHTPASQTAVPRFCTCKFMEV